MKQLAWRKNGLYFSVSKSSLKKKKKHCISITDSMLMIQENTLKEKCNQLKRRSKPTSGTLSFNDCFTSSCSQYLSGKLGSQTIEKGYWVCCWVYNACDLTAINESNETAEIGQREKLGCSQRDSSIFWDELEEFQKLIWKGYEPKKEAESLASVSQEKQVI